MTEHPPRKNKIKTNLERKKGQARKRKLIALVLLLLSVLIIYHPMKNFIVSKLIRYEIAQWKVLEQSVPEEGVVIRGEVFITAPENGEFEPIVPEGEKVAVGSIIGYVKTYAGTDKVDLIKIAVKAPVAGLVSYHPDGLEDVLKPDLLNSLDIDKVSPLLEEKKEESSSFPKVEKGEAFCKIIDNLANPFLYLQFSDASTAPNIEKGQVMSVRFPDEIVTKIIVHDLKKGNNQFVMLAEIFDAPDLNLKTRFVPVDLISDYYEGVVVLAEALVKENGEDGVFITKKGLCKWVRVEIQGQVDEEAVVSGLEPGSQYIVNTSLVCSGQRIY